MNKMDYISEKQEGKKSAKQGMMMVIVFIVIFMLVIFRFAVRPGTNEGFFSPMPTGDEAYDAAKDFIKPLNADAEFPEGEYQYSKNSDSVYVIKSYFDIRKENGDNVVTDFTATLKYNGGSTSNTGNWSLITLDR